MPAGARPARRDRIPGRLSGPLGRIQRRLVFRYDGKRPAVPKGPVVHRPARARATPLVRPGNPAPAKIDPPRGICIAASRVFESANSGLFTGSTAWNVRGWTLTGAAGPEYGVVFQGKQGAAVQSFDRGDNLGGGGGGGAVRQTDARLREMGRAGGAGPGAGIHRRAACVVVLWSGDSRTMPGETGRTHRGLSGRRAGQACRSRGRC